MPFESSVCSFHNSAMYRYEQTMDEVKECEDDDAEKLFINESKMLFRRDFLRLYSAVVFLLSLCHHQNLHAKNQKKSTICPDYGIMLCSF